MAKYDTGNNEWHLLELVKPDDPWSVVHYVMQNDLGKNENAIHQRWAHFFLQTIRQIQRRMKQSNIFLFYASSLHPTNKKFFSCHTQKLRRVANDLDTHDAKAHATGKQYVDKIEYGHAVSR